MSLKKKIYNLEETGKQVIANKQDTAEQAPKVVVEQQPTTPVEQPQMFQADLIPTSEIIKNIEVSFEIVPATKASVQSQPVAMMYEITEEKSPEVVFEISSQTKEIQVNNPTRVVPITEETSEGIRKYSLEETMDVQRSVLQSGVHSQGIEQEDIKIVVKTEAVTESETKEVSNFDIEEDEISPEDMSIDEMLKLQKEKRKQTFKNYNHTFRNISSQQLEELEKEPAFKRQNLSLEKQQEKSQSRTSLSLDSNNELQIRNNNSFLHDNVD